MADLKEPAGRLVAQNRKARHNYLIEETLEVGIMLTGTEVKSLRGGRANIAESYAHIAGDEVILVNVYIPEYPPAHSSQQHDTRRPRKLLLHRREIDSLAGQLKQGGMTLVPLTLYFNPRGIAKVRLGLARGKSKVDKRESEKARDWKRQKERLMREKG
ncbi:MAG: SsrA-binding protein SmpB [Acetobacterales bacterium]